MMNQLKRVNAIQTSDKKKADFDTQISEIEKNY